jgi:Fanconi anemia group M protein
MKSVLKNIDMILNPIEKRSFSVPEKMKVSEINFNPRDRNGNNDDDDDYFNPVMDSISSNSGRKVKYFLKKLSYQKKDVGNRQSSFENNDLEHLYDVSLALDGRKIVEKAQRQIHDLLAKSGKNGLEISYLQDMIKFDGDTIHKAIKNLEKLKRIVWIDKKTISLIDAIKFIPGKKYSIFIENVLSGKAVVIVNEKWYASLNYFDYAGPRALLKKGNTFDIIGELYKKNGTLCLTVKKTM